MQMLLALNGRMGRLIMAQWLQKNLVYTYEAPEWNELTQTLQEHFKASNVHSLPSEFSECKELDTQGSSISVVIIIIDIGLLDLSTDIWKEQLSYLDNYSSRAKFAWILNHDTSNTIKAELRRRGYSLMVNRPLYKAKIIQILEAVIKDQNMKIQKQLTAHRTTVVEGNFSEYHEIDATHSCAASSDESDKAEHDDPRYVSPSYSRETRNEQFSRATPFLSSAPNRHCVEFAQNFDDDTCKMEEPGQTREKDKKHMTFTCTKERDTVCISTSINEQRSLEGLCILLAEDTPVLQRVATIMLEKLGAKVVVVGDGLQAVDALKFMLHLSELRKESPVEGDNSETMRPNGLSLLPYDLILMDCQVRCLKISLNLIMFFHIGSFLLFHSCRNL